MSRFAQDMLVILWVGILGLVALDAVTETLINRAINGLEGTP